jgi:hypothetical protein
MRVTGVLGCSSRLTSQSALKAVIVQASALLLVHNNNAVLYGENVGYRRSAARSSGIGTVAMPIAASPMPYGSTRVSACTSAPHE